MDPGIEWRGRGWRLVGQGSEKREEILVDVDAQRAYGEHVATQMELAVLARGQEERAVDVRLHDEMAKLGGDDAMIIIIIGGGRDRGCRVGVFLGVGWVRVGVGFRFGGIGVPFLEDGAELGFGAEEADALAAVAHAGFQDPPFEWTVGCGGVSGEAVVQLVGLEKGVVEELGVVELEIQGWLDVLSEEAGWVFGAPGRDGASEIMLADQGFADDVGVREGC